MKRHLRNITLGLDPTTVSSPQGTDLSLDVSVLPGCLLETFTDTVLVTLLLYFCDVWNAELLILTLTLEPY